MVRLATVAALCCVLCSKNAFAQHGQCRDGLDNDFDGRIDALIERLPNMAGFVQFSSPVQIRDFVNSFPRFSKIPSHPNHQGFVLAELGTATRICQLRGYAQVARGFDGTLAWASSVSQDCSSNTVAFWEARRGDFTIIGGCIDQENQVSHQWLTFLRCQGVFAACGDGLDNDGDGVSDWPNDTGCASLHDTSEIQHDPDCLNPGTPSEGGLCTGDFPPGRAPPGCEDPAPDKGQTACTDGFDNDGDGLIDAQDPACWRDPRRPETYEPLLRNEALVTTQCQDGRDNDNDGLFDAQDPGCRDNIALPTSYNRRLNDESIDGVPAADTGDQVAIDPTANPVNPGELRIAGGGCGLVGGAVSGGLLWFCLLVLVLRAGRSS